MFSIILLMEHCPATDYIDSRLKRIPIPNKGYGIITLKKIPKNTIIIKETPAFSLDQNSDIISDVIQLIYQILTSDSPKKIRQFLNFYPSSTKNFRHYQIPIEKELAKLKYSKYQHIYHFLLENYTIDEILLFAAKYMCNAFKPNAILFTGAQMNHACLPNTIFYQKKNKFYFRAVRDIDEEILINYVDLTNNREVRQKRLNDQYGFTCDCIRCIHKNPKYYDNKAKQIMDLKNSLIDPN